MKEEGNRKGGGRRKYHYPRYYYLRERGYGGKIEGGREMEKVGEGRTKEK